MKITADDMRLVRGHLDLTQAEMAEHLGVSPRTVVNWETNGVPDSKAARTLKVIGKSLENAKLTQAHIADLEQNPIPFTEDDERWAEMQQESQEEPLGMTAEERRSYLLQAFSDVDLSNELRARALRRGDRASLWNAERMERYQRFVAPKWEEPDYSQMSDEDAKDYGLAANTGDPDIEHDELPHEP